MLRKHKDGYKHNKNIFGTYTYLTNIIHIICILVDEINVIIERNMFVYIDRW